MLFLGVELEGVEMFLDEEVQIHVKVFKEYSKMKVLEEQQQTSFLSHAEDMTK